MSRFFSGSSSQRRYPNPGMGGRHYRKKGLFGMFSGSGSFSGSGGRRGCGYRQDPRYFSQEYPGQPGFQQNTPGAGGQTACSRCGALVPAGSKFCLSCGERMNTGAAFCPNCGKPLPAGAKFCMECGTPVQR